MTDARKTAELFQSNDLSRVKPEFVQLSNQEWVLEISNMLKTAYNFLDLKSIQLKRFDGNSAISQNFLVIDGERKYIFKCRCGLERSPWLLQEASLAKQLHSKGVSAPQVINNASGEEMSYSVDKCWLLYEFQEGDYFTGKGSELDAAAEVFGKLSLVCQSLKQKNLLSPFDIKTEFLEDLEHLLDDATHNSGIDPTFSNLCLEHSDYLRQTFRNVVKKRQEIEVQWGLTHTDYHPLNLLMKNEKVVCVLDFEDLQRYPLNAALGFGGYKLIRQMMVDPAIRESDRLYPTLLRRWLRGWKKSFPDVSLKAETLNLSTKYRVLSLIHTIFYTYLRLNDDSFNYDLAKQIGSLYEIDTIMSC